MSRNLLALRAHALLGVGDDVTALRCMVFASPLRCANACLLMQLEHEYVREMLIWNVFAMHTRQPLQFIPPLAGILGAGPLREGDGTVPSEDFCLCGAAFMLKALPPP